jgi:hypothetical protein
MTGKTYNQIVRAHDRAVMNMIMVSPPPSCSAGKGFQNSPNTCTDRISEWPKVHLVRGLVVDDAVIWQLTCGRARICASITEGEPFLQDRTHRVSYEHDVE